MGVKFDALLSKLREGEGSSEQGNVIIYGFEWEPIAKRRDFTDDFTDDFI